MMRWAFAMSAEVFLLQGIAGACVWDTDTLRDELQMNADILDLITGQFPHHGKGYYEARARRLEPKVRAGSTDVEVLNDLGVAYLKLGRFDESRRTFDRIEGIAPGRYETLSNLGVLEKKRGDFAAAAAFTEKALALRPEGHLGLGDYYLHMLRWQEKARKQRVTLNFLEVPYDAPLHNRETKVDLDRLQAFIRSDRTFADAFVVLGDLLHNPMGRGDMNVALWSYVRALDLGHPRPDAIRSRIQGIFSHWSESARQRRGRRVKDMEAAIEGIRADLALARDWLTRFEEVEAELAASRTDVDFDAVETELGRMGIRKMESGEHGMSRGWDIGDLKSVSVMVAALAAVLGLWHISRRVRRSS